MTAIAERLQITEPGVYDIPAEIYHADPVPGGSLSASGAKMLLPPSCPALFRYRMDHQQPYRPEFAIGHAAHKEVLGTGPDLAVIDADDWRTKAAREERDEAHAAGLVPLLAGEYEQVQAMAAVIRQHPIASVLFDPARGGKAEQAMFWRDRETGLMRRALVDWLPASTGTGRLIVADYKTCVSAEPTAISKAVANYGYLQQDDWYRDGVLSLGLAEQAAFVFVFQEKTAPYLVTVVELDRDAQMWGDALNRRAIEIYRHCMETGRWPGYSDEVVLTSLPVWAERGYEAIEGIK